MTVRERGIRKLITDGTNAATIMIKKALLKIAIFVWYGMGKGVAERLPVIREQFLVRAGTELVVVLYVGHSGVFLFRSR